MPGDDTSTRKTSTSSGRPIAPSTGMASRGAALAVESFGSLASGGASVGSDGGSGWRLGPVNVPRGAGVRDAIGIRAGRVSAGSGREPLGRVPVGRGELVGGGTSGAVAV